MQPEAVSIWKDRYSEKEQLTSVLGNIQGWIESEICNQPLYIKTTVSFLNLKFLVDGRIFTNGNNEDCLLRLRKVETSGIIKVSIEKKFSYN